MKSYQKKKKAIGGMIILIVILNILISIALYKNLNLIWLLAVSIPLFVIAVYFAKQIVFKIPPAKRKLQDLRRSNFENLSNSVYPTKITSADLKIKIGNDQCSQPYHASILNIGSLEIAYAQTLYTSPKEFQNSVTDTFDTYHLAAGGYVWQISAGYTGCCTETGFNSRLFKEISIRPDIKMIELKLFSTNSLNYSGDSDLGFEKTDESKKDCRSFPGSAFNTFSDAEGMIHFLTNLRELSGGKPIGIRICINDKKEFYNICYAIQKTQIIPDFIVIEGSSQTTRIVHSNQPVNGNMPLYDSLLFVSQTLEIYGLKNKIRIIADGRIISSFDILKVIALGADVVFTTMPRYKIISNPKNESKSDLQLKSQNESDFYYELMQDTIQVMKICGFRSVRDITLPKFFNRLDVIHSEGFSEVSAPALFPGNIKKVYNSIISSPN